MTSVLKKVFWHTHILNILYTISGSWMPYGLSLNLLEVRQHQNKNFDSVYNKCQQPVQYVPCYKGHIGQEERVET